MLFQLNFPSGAVANCMTSFGINMNYLNVSYEKGWLKMEPQSGYSGNKGEMSNGTIINNIMGNQQPKQLDDDCLALLNNTPLLVPGQEGWRDLRVVDAIKKAAKSGRLEKV